MVVFKKARLILESLMARVGLLVIPILHRRIIRILATIAGKTAYIFSRKLRHIALANLDIAFGNTLSAGDKQQIARQSFCFTALVILDFFWFSRHMETRIMKYVSLDPSMKAYLEPTPVIGVTAHFGNWELISKAGAANGIDHVVVVSPLKNPDVDRLFNRSRDMPGIEVIPKQGAIRALLTSLRKNKRIALALDQNTRPEEGGVFVNLFGLPTPISSAAAMLSERTQTPVVVLFCLAQRDGTYHLYARPPIIPKPKSEPSGNKTASEITQAIALAFEQEIKTHPEQWLWMYKRWKYIATDMPRDAYPFYSRPV